ncbi:transposase domain-containing protein, partial [Methylocystis sp.]|uniref:transposase domain-containing protein n=1 Tax=Methylocystis sp. TaxID=1911079 RepID=UPI003D13B4E8
IEKLKMQLAILRRARFGRSSEKLDRDIEQLELLIGDIEESDACPRKAKRMASCSRRFWRRRRVMLAPASVHIRCMSKPAARRGQARRRSRDGCSGRSGRWNDRVRPRHSGGRRRAGGARDRRRALPATRRAAPPDVRIEPA